MYLDCENDVMRRTEYDGHEIVVTDGHHLYVDGHDITEEYRGRSITEDVLYEVKHRIANGELPPDDHEVLTREELLKVMSALPSGWEPGDDIEFEDVDWETLKPLSDKYGGMQGLVQAVKRSTETADEVHPQNASSLSHVDETPQQSTERPEGPVEEAKAAYIEGDIGVLELEDRLEDAIELDHEPTAHPS